MKTQHMANPYIYADFSTLSSEVQTAKHRAMLFLLVPRFTDYKILMLYESCVHAVRSGSVVGGQFESNLFTVGSGLKCQGEYVGFGAV